MPFIVLIAYTVGGAYIFRYFELQEDEERRIRYRQNTEYAFKRVKLIYFNLKIKYCKWMIHLVDHLKTLRRGLNDLKKDKRENIR